MYNATNEERRRRAASDLAKKLMLEVKLAKEMRSIFRSVANTSKEMYLANGGRLSVMTFKPQFKDALSKHYRRVFRVFQPDMLDDLSKYSECLHCKDANDSLDLYNQTYVATQSDSSSNQIVSTTQKKLNQAYGAALASYLIPDEDSDPNITIDRDAVAADAIDNFSSDADSRSAIIATTETQAAAETGKINTVSSVVDPLAASEAEKSWATIMDGRERPSHAAANGQVQSLTSPFIVQGELLNYPSDNSLGASASNIIKCRCSAQYIIP